MNLLLLWNSRSQVLQWGELKYYEVERIIEKGTAKEYLRKATYSAPEVRGSPKELLKILQSDQREIIAEGQYSIEDKCLRIEKILWMRPKP